MDLSVSVLSNIQTIYNNFLYIIYFSDYEILTIFLTDFDKTRPNSNIDVIIQEDDVPFQISNSWVISLKNGQSLDYDVASSYTFTLVAEDGGRDGSAKTSSASVTISIFSGTLLLFSKT